MLKGGLRCSRGVTPDRLRSAHISRMASRTQAGSAKVWAASRGAWVSPVAVAGGDSPLANWGRARLESRNRLWLMNRRLDGRCRLVGRVSFMDVVPISLENLRMSFIGLVFQGSPPWGRTNLWCIFSAFFWFPGFANPLYEVYPNQAHGQVAWRNTVALSGDRLDDHGGARCDQKKHRLTAAAEFAVIQAHPNDRVGA